jgi:RNA polymerase sigma-70 factor (ECF subfamily)
VPVQQTAIAAQKRAIAGFPLAVSAAFNATEILLGHRPALLRFLAARRVSREDAEDLLQDLFIRFEGRSFGPIVYSRAYLYRAVDNLLLDRRRSARRRAEREVAWVGTQNEGSMEIDDRPSAERSLLARERLSVASQTLAALPDRTATIFRKFRLEGIGQKQIAAELGISLSAVEKHLQKAYCVLTKADRGYRAESDPPGTHRI